MAELIGRLIVLLIPIFGLLLPMMHFLPRMYNWVMRSRILRIYGELRLLEDATSRDPGSDQRKMLAQLDRLEEQVNHLRLPVAYANMLYELRAHIDLVRGRPRKPALDETSPGP